jgi:hypothetical protein
MTCKRMPGGFEEAMGEKTDVTNGAQVDAQPYGIQLWEPLADQMTDGRVPWASSSSR